MKWTVSHICKLLTAVTTWTRPPCRSHNFKFLEALTSWTRPPCRSHNLKLFKASTSRIRPPCRSQPQAPQGRHQMDSQPCSSHNLELLEALTSWTRPPCRSHNVKLFKVTHPRAPRDHHLLDSLAVQVTHNFKFLKAVGSSIFGLSARLLSLLPRQLLPPFQCFSCLERDARPLWSPFPSSASLSLESST